MFSTVLTVLIYMKADSHRYYLTRAGRAAIAAGRRLTEHTIIPALA